MQIAHKTNVARSGDCAGLSYLPLRVDVSEFVTILREISKSSIFKRKPIQLSTLSSIPAPYSYNQSPRAYVTHGLNQRTFKMLSSFRKLTTMLLLYIAPITDLMEYAAFTTEALIPFYPVPENEPPNVPFTARVRVNVKLVRDGVSNTHNPSIDTGTCGYIVSKDGFPGDVPPDAPIGWEFLSSSKLLYSGHWVTADVHYIDAAVELKARFPILVVNERSVCPNYNTSVDTNVCPSATNIIRNPTEIALFGVGFGRQFDGQPQGNPDKNPFLNVVSIGGVQINTSTTFRNGFIISKEGITIGLTGANTAGYAFTDLIPGLHHSESPLDWAPVPACIRVNDMPSCVVGTALLDTGISHSYLTLPYDSPVYRHNATSPSSGAAVLALDDGSLIQIGIGAGNKVVNDDFYVGSRSGMANGPVPLMVITTLTNSKPPYVNTGRFFFRAWNVAFDPVGGRMGFKRVYG